jgi:hypothetical protein
MGLKFTGTLTWPNLNTCPYFLEMRGAFENGDIMPSIPEADCGRQSGYACPYNAYPQWARTFTPEGEQVHRRHMYSSDNGEAGR